MDLEVHKSEVSLDVLAGEPSLLSKSAQGATFLIALQIGSRLLTFAVNQLLLRFLSPDILGISTQLEVYSISVLFFAREALRVAVQRQTDSRDEGDEAKQNKSGQERTEARPSQEAHIARKTQEIVNLAYISIILGIIFAVLLAWGYWHSLRSAPFIVGTPHFRLALELYGVATLFELSTEPCFVVVQQKSEYKIRAAAEAAATVSRCIVTCSSVVFAASYGIDVGVLPFALGQCVYGLSLSYIYYQKVSALAIGQGFSLKARTIGSSDGDYIVSYFSRSLLTLGASLFAQGIVKHLLTQGDVLLISYLAPLEAQGIYALVSNYGGLIARMLFQPIEESSRSYFGKLLSSIDGKPSQATVQAASRDLHSLLKLYVLLSISAVTIGPSLAPLLLNLVAGSRWTSTGAGNVLSKFCYYIPMLAINGVTEAFISSIATESELNGQSAWMFAFSIAFAVAGYVFLQIFEMGAEGLVWANSMNMALRIAWSSHFINNYLKRNGSSLSLKEMMAQPSTVALGVCIAAIMAQIRTDIDSGATDIIKSGSVAGLFVVLLAISERECLRHSYSSFRKSR